MNIGLVAHDAKKVLMQNFCIAYRGILCRHELYATGTTGRLIEEVANIIEEVVLIDKGKVLLQNNVNSLLETGFSVSGLAHEVDAYCADKNVIGYDELSNLKIAYVLDEKTPLPKTANLSLSAMNLQKLFVKLTEKGDL